LVWVQGEVTALREDSNTELGLEKFFPMDAVAFEVDRVQKASIAPDHLLVFDVVRPQIVEDVQELSSGAMAAFLFSFVQKRRQGGGTTLMEVGETELQNELL
jgi:hypothetical protein